MASVRAGGRWRALAGHFSAPPRLVVLALLSAVLMSLAFPSVDAGWLAWVGLAPLLYAMQRARRARGAFLLAYLFGIAHWGSCTTWIGDTVVGWSGTPLGWVAWVGLTLVEALWFAGFGLLAYALGRVTRGPARILSTAAVWVVMEWLRSQGSLAMPWLLAGYTQHRYAHVLQVADLTGVYGLSFLLLLTNAALAELSDPTLENRKSKIGNALLPLAFLSAALLYGTFRLRLPDMGPRVRVAVMQPNLKSGRTATMTAEQTFAVYRGMMADLRAASPQAPALVVWPESAAPNDAVNDPYERAMFRAMAQASGAYHLLGTGYEDAAGREYASAALFGPDGRLLDRYDKHWLVPYGEWMPARRWMPFGDVFHFIRQDVTAGTRNEPLLAGPTRLSALICYESVFPSMARARVGAGANVLAAISNDSWAGVSSEQAQHMAMTALRAVETRRYVASSTSTGVTGFVDPWGRQRDIPRYRQGLLVADVRLREDRTVYVRWGDWLVWLCAGWMAAVCVRAGLRSRAG